MGYERRLKERRGELRLCWEELKEKRRERQLESEWKEKRRRFFRERG